MMTSFRYRAFTVRVDEYTYETLKLEAEKLDPISPEIGPVVRRWLREMAGKRRPHVEKRKRKNRSGSP